MVTLRLPFLKLIIHLFLAVLGPHCRTWAFSSCGVWASHCSGFSCCGAEARGEWASVVAARQAQWLWLVS